MATSYATSASRFRALSARQFTDSASTLVCQMSDRAGERGLFAPSLGAVAALAVWTVIRWERKVGLVALETLGIDPISFAREIDALLIQAALETPVSGKDGVLVHAVTLQPILADWDHAFEPLLLGAQAAARDLGHSYVGTEHLLVAAIALADNKLAEVLQRHDVTTDRTMSAIKQVLQS